jgi:hypothetical protein
MSERELTLEATMKVYNHIMNNPRKNINYVMRDVVEEGVSRIQFNKAHDLLYDKILIKEVKIPTGVGLEVEHDLLNPEGILKKYFERFSKS